MRTSTIKVILISLLWVNPSFGLDTAAQEKTCSEIGFKKKTEAFGNCVLELVSRSGGAPSQSSQTSSASDPDDATCKKYGFRPNTNEYAQCRLQIDQARVDAQRQQAQFEQQQKQYQDQLDAQKKRRSDAANMAMLSMGLGMMAGGASPGSSINQQQVAPQKPMNEYRTYSLPNGQSMRCNSFGNNVQCF
jgi:hypothetical protein